MVTKPQDGGKLKEKLVAPVLHTAQLLLSSRSQLQDSYSHVSVTLQTGQYTLTCLPPALCLFRGVDISSLLVIKK